MRTFVVAVALVLAVLFAIFPGRAFAVDRSFAGSAQLDYYFVPTARSATLQRPTLEPGRLGIDGLTIEAAVKASVDVTDHLSANVKVCFGCHGFEADMAYLDYRVADEFNVRVGRFSPSFGNFNLRHDPANHRLSSKPLPYDMGRMIRLREWNMGVLPSPFPDQGIELNGTHWFGEKAQFDYAAYAVTGFRGGATPADFDFKLSRSPLYIDNNGRPTVGGRMALTLKLGETSDATLGASAMYGTYDQENELEYLIAGGDLTFRFARTNVRFEYLVRRQKFDRRNPTGFKYQLAASPDDDIFAKHGAYAEIEHPITPVVDLLGRVDGMFRVGNVLANSELLRKSSVIRYTLGTLYTIERGFRIKFSGELWQFTDEAPTGNKIDLGIHLAAVGTF